MSHHLLPYLLSELLESSNNKPPHHHHHYHHRINPEAELLLTTLLHPHGGYYRPWKSGAAAQDNGSIVHLDKHRYQVHLDVQQFAPEEITVKVTGENIITVEGKHEEKEDEHGFVKRHFVRRYLVPKGCDMDGVESRLSSDGVLSIVVPKIGVKDVEERAIPITQTGKPSKAVEDREKKGEDEQQVNGDN